MKVVMDEPRNLLSYVLDSPMKDGVGYLNGYEESWVDCLFGTGSPKFPSGKGRMVSRFYFRSVIIMCR